MMRAGIPVWIVLACIAPFAGAVAAPAPPRPLAHTDPIQTIRTILGTPEDQIDLAAAKLTLDKIIDPSIDISTSLHQIDEMERQIGVMAGRSASARQKLTAVRNYLFVSGDWNNHQPYQYDLGDPLGKKITNKLLPNYLASKRGNCVTMPYLFIVLASRMGLHVSAATAPLHIFVKFTDDATGETFNIEATNGGHVTRDVWYKQMMPMTDTAIANGLYMKALTKKETLAVMADTVVEFYLSKKQDEQAIAVANLILAAYPNDVHALLKRGTAYADLLDTRFTNKYATPNDIPTDLRSDYESLVENNQADFERAETLGWRPTE